MMQSHQSKMGTSRIVFLDRDGVINRDSPNYIKSWQEFNFLPGSRRALAKLNHGGFSTILITNQSAVSRGLITRPRLGRIHQRLCSAVAARGGHIRDIFFCPHHPEENCLCRKPANGMLQQAAAKYGLNLPNTFFIGDSAKDIICARGAGCGKTVLVQTGNGPTALEDLTRQGCVPDYVATDLRVAAEWIVSCPHPWATEL